MLQKYVFLYHELITYAAVSPIEMGNKHGSVYDIQPVLMDAIFFFFVGYRLSDVAQNGNPPFSLFAPNQPQQTKLYLPNNNLCRLRSIYRRYFTNNTETELTSIRYVLISSRMAAATLTKFPTNRATLSNDKTVFFVPWWAHATK